MSDSVLSCPLISSSLQIEFQDRVSTDWDVEERYIKEKSIFCPHKKASAFPFNVLFSLAYL